MLYDPQDERFACSYKPCGHEEIIHFVNKAQVDLGTRFCPKCNLFTLKYKPLSGELLQRISEIDLEAEDE